MRISQNVPSFDEIKLGKAVVFQRGFDITKREQAEGNIPIVSSSGVSSYHNKWKVAGPGVVIGRKGTLGTVHYLKDNFWPHDTTLWIKDFKDNDPRLVSYFLQTLKLENFDTGSSNPTLNRNHLHKIKVLFPRHQVQKKIAAILSAYDDLIENNRRRIALLEKMAEEIYREWFVRMRFPGHDKLKLESIPLRSFIHEYIGGDWGEDEEGTKHANPVYVIRGTDFENVQQGDVSSVPLRFIKDSSLRSRKLRAGDIIVENSVNHQSRTTGKSLLITQHVLDLFGGNVICASFCKLVRPKNSKYSKLLSLNLRLLFEQGVFEYFQNVATNGIANLQAERLMDKHTVPFHEDIDVEVLNSLDTSQFTLQQANLSNTRDMLLPRLISGKLSVENLDILLPPSMEEVA